MEKDVKMNFKKNATYVNTCFVKNILWLEIDFFLCDNCMSIWQVRQDVGKAEQKCLMATLYCSCCFCIGPLSYCAAIYPCLKTWGENAHNKYKIQNEAHIKCVGFKALCGLIHFECPGHGPEMQRIVDDEKEDNVKEDNVKQPLSPNVNRVVGNKNATNNVNNSGNNINEVIGDDNATSNVNG